MAGASTPLPWEGIRAHFQSLGVAMDFALFSNYERQVEGLLHTPNFM